MKATELFYHAIVQPLAKNIGSPCYVIGVDYELGTCNLRRFCDNEVFNDVPCSQIVAVTLTPEILEKNGFEKSEYGWWNRKIGEWEIEIYIGRIDAFVKINKGVYPHINNTDCHFVHQLQHALKLCGIELEIKI